MSEVIELNPKQKLELPDGLIGDLAFYILDTAKLPVVEYAFAAAFSLVAGLAQRAYTISDTGLNAYIVVLGNSGTGKGGISSSIDSILKQIYGDEKRVYELMGAGTYASGQALIKGLDKNPSLFSVFSEYGELQSTLASSPHQAHKKLNSILRDVWAKSGPDESIRPMEYADSEKNTQVIEAPCFSFVGETNPEEFGEACVNGSISNGWLPRLTLIEFSGLRPRMNKSKKKPMSEALRTRLVTLAKFALELDRRKDIDMTRDAEMLYDAFCDGEQRQAINTNGEAIAVLWNGANLKVMRYAGLVAVSVNQDDPEVDEDCMNWAITFVRKEIALVVRKSKDEGLGDAFGNQQEAEFFKFFDQYLGYPPVKQRGLPGVNKGNYKVACAYPESVPLGFIRHNCINRACFKNDRNGAGKAFDGVVRSLLNSAMLYEISRDMLLSRADESFDDRAKVVYKPE